MPQEEVKGKLGHIITSKICEDIQWTPLITLSDDLDCTRIQTVINNEIGYNVFLAFTFKINHKK